MDSKKEVHIILAEDHDGARVALVNLLNRNFSSKFPSTKFIIHDCADGAIALSMFNELAGQGISPGIIITDRNMPNMDGFQFLESDAVRAESGAAKIMYSGMEMSEDKRAFTEAIKHAAMDDVRFFVKPDQLQEFKTAILEEAAKLAAPEQVVQRPVKYTETVRKDLGVALGLTPRFS